MKASKFSEAQIAFVLKQAEDGTPIGEVCRKAGISDATFYNWRKKYAGLMPSEMVIPPFLTGHIGRFHAAIFSFCAGVMPPMPILGRSLL